MASHLLSHEARTQGLPGSDVFRSSHLLYRDELHRDHGAVKLNIEALRAFGDTILIARRSELKKEQAAAAEWVALGGFDSGRPYPWDGVSMSRMEYINYEHLKIACGFELHLKARLLARDVIIHEIDPKAAGCRDLAVEQTQRPIKREELFGVTQYRFDGKSNYLPGLKKASLRFSWLTEKREYVIATALPVTLIEIIDEFRELRNQIHFPGDVVETPKINALQRPISSVLVEFLNEQVIEWSNELIATNRMNWPPLDPLSDA